MPRKKRPTYNPLEVFESAGLIVEVYADDELPNGRGLPGKRKKIETFNRALEILWDAQAVAKKGLRTQLFADMRISAVVLERELTKKHGRSGRCQLS